MNIKTDYWIKPIPLRGCDWTAWDDDTYDGASDAGPLAHAIGYGRTRDEAIEDLFNTRAELSDEDYAGGAEQAQRIQDAREGFNDD